MCVVGGGGGGGGGRERGRYVCRDRRLPGCQCTGLEGSDERFPSRGLMQDSCVGRKSAAQPSALPPGTKGLYVGHTLLSY